MSPDPKAILIIEDEHDLRVSLRDLLEQSGYAVLSASHGAAALELIESGPAPDLIVLDLKMPIMDGHAFLDRIREDARLARVKTLVLTADRSAKQPAGACCLLLKPAEPDEILARIRGCLAPHPA